MSVQIKGTGNSVLPGADLTTPLAQASGGTGGNYPVYQMVLATAQNATSGTSIDFTGIPSWVKRITVMLSAVSTNGTSPLVMRIGAGSIESTGYTGVSELSGAPTATLWGGTSIETEPSTGSTVIRVGKTTLVTPGSNVWIIDSMIGRTDSGFIMKAAGSKTTSSTLDRVRLTTVNGTDTFDAGSVNIMYEG